MQTLWVWRAAYPLLLALIIVTSNPRTRSIPYLRYIVCKSIIVQCIHGNTTIKKKKSFKYLSRLQKRQSAIAVRPFDLSSPRAVWSSLDGRNNNPTSFFVTWTERVLTSTHTSTPSLGFAVLVASCYSGPLTLLKYPGTHAPTHARTHAHTQRHNRGT